MTTILSLDAAHYDANGNQTTRVIAGQTFTLAYNAENQLITVSGPSMTASFVYDGDGVRVKSTVNDRLANIRDFENLGCFVITQFLQGYNLV